VGAGMCQAAPPDEHLVDIGEELDETIVGEGVHVRENPGPGEKYHQFFHTCSFRWFANRWTLTLPAFSGRDNLVTFRAKLERGMDLSFGPGFTARIETISEDGEEYSVLVPAEAIGQYETLHVAGSADPSFVSTDRDRRERAWAVDWVRVKPVDERPEGVPVATATGPVQWPEERFINIGTEGDEDAIIEGAYQREGYNPSSRSPFYRWCNFRWFGNEWAMSLPVYANRNNEVVFRGQSSRMLRMSVPGIIEDVYLPPRPANNEYRIVLTAGAMGDRETIELRGAAIPPVVLADDSRDKRELVITIDWFRVRPLEEADESIMALQQLPDTREPDLPLPFRLRGSEIRPLVTDVESYVLQARMMRNNVMTIGPMNGQHWTAFETKDGIPAQNMQPDFIPRQIAALHEWGIAAIGWLPFNVQDTRKVEDCQAARKYPDWTMKFIEWAEGPPGEKVGMCVVSSPWREVHAGILTEAAALGLDGVFFDGFYLGGVPHPIAPGCVCHWCQEKFKAETGLDTPARVDWTDPVFKRWVRWRNHKLIETALYFRDRMREANPDLQVTCNYNIWPFGRKDWDTAIPLWSQTGFGVSQHGYTSRLDMEWLMPGFKARVSHDLNPAHSDMWRSSRYTWNTDNSSEDHARQELNMRTFMLAALAHGTTPWHGGNINPPEAGIRIHEAVREREGFFSQDEVRHLGVVLSQNTHDFWGHIPETTNLLDYQDGILGGWLMLTENHVPFRFVFDNQIEAGELGDYAALLLPNMACVSDEMAARLAECAAAGGRIIATGATGEFDEWGDPRPANALREIESIVRLAGTPCLTWVRKRDDAAERAVIEAIAQSPAPWQVQAPRSLCVVGSWAPGRSAVWLHLLNASAFYPLGDTGFRGQESEPVYAGDVAGDADIMPGGKVKRVTVPATDIVVTAPGLDVASVRLGIAGTTIEPDADGRFVIPEIDVHDVLILELAD
jgi:hypothetical protein